jgi:hypothetical protein
MNHFVDELNFVYVLLKQALASFAPGKKYKD